MAVPDVSKQVPPKPLPLTFDPGIIQVFMFRY